MLINLQCILNTAVTTYILAHMQIQFAILNL